MTSETRDGRQYKAVRLDPLINQQVGRYIVKRKIGQGGMGVVYEVWDVDLDKRLAMKVVLIRRSTSEDDDDEQTQTNRFLQEAKAASRVGGRHAALIYGTGQLADGRHYIVMEYLEGEDLRQRIQNVKRRMNPDDVIAIGMQMARVLHKAHCESIIHRDVKPSNIFLARVEGEEVAKLLDFGIAKVNVESTALCMPTAVETQEHLVLGSYAYMSPEQLVSPRLVDYRTDLFSLGVVLYEMITGHTAYPAETAIQHYELRKKPPRAVGEVRFDYSIVPEWDVLLRWMLSWNPGDRPKDMRAVAVALSHLSPNGAALLSHWWRELWRRDTSMKIAMPTSIPASDNWQPISNGVPVERDEGEQVISMEAGEPAESAVMVSESQIQEVVSHVHQPKPVADWSTVGDPLENYMKLTGGTRISTGVHPVSLSTISGVPRPVVMQGPQHEKLIAPPTPRSAIQGEVSVMEPPPSPMAITNPSNPSISFAAGVMQPMAPPVLVQPPHRWTRTLGTAGLVAISTAAAVAAVMRFSGARRDAFQPAAAVSPVRAPAPEPHPAPAPVITPIPPAPVQLVEQPAPPAAPVLTPIAPSDEDKRKAKEAKRRRHRTTTTTTAIDPDGVM